MSSCSHVRILKLSNKRIKYYKKEKQLRHGYFLSIVSKMYRVT